MNFTKHFPTTRMTIFCMAALFVACGNTLQAATKTKQTTSPKTEITPSTRQEILAVVKSRGTLPDALLTIDEINLASQQGIDTTNPRALGELFQRDFEPNSKVDCLQQAVNLVKKPS